MAEHRVYVMIILAGVVSLLLAQIIPGYLVLLCYTIIAKCCSLLLRTATWLRGKSKTKSARSASSSSKSSNGKTSASSGNGNSVGNGQLPDITWEELSQHCTAKSAWIAVHGKVYDVTEFLEHHPGGHDMLLLACGRESTAAFISYHPFTTKPNSLRHKYEIGNLSTSEHPTFKPDSGFYRECCQEVAEYFKRTGQDSKPIFPVLWRLVMIYTVWTAAYIVSYAWPYSVPLSVRCMAAAIQGLVMALTLLHATHDASHASFSHHAALWRFATRFTMDWSLGLSATAWYSEHIVGHHIYCNVIGSDPDVPTRLDDDPRRLFPLQKWKKIYRYQHVYLPIAYCLLGFKYRYDEVVAVLTQEYNNIRMNYIPWSERLHLISTKIFFLWVNLCVPYGALGVSALELALLFLIHNVVFSVYMAGNFAVSHGNDVTDSFLGTSTNGNSAPVEEEWAKVQMRTTMDFSHDSPAAFYLSGGMNYQVIHHLFPSVSHVYYPDIAVLVKKVCRKYSVTYHCQPDYMSAVWSHMALLRHLGEEGIAASLKFE